MKVHITPTTKSFLLGLSISLLVVVSALGGAIADRLFVIRPLDYLLRKAGQSFTNSSIPALPVPLSENENTIIGVSEKASQSVVTVSIKKKQSSFMRISPFDMFGFGFQSPQQEPEEIQQDIGTGFVVDGGAGIIVTNKHVISDTSAEYSVIDKDGKEYPVKHFYRDPSNDIGIVQIDGQLPSMVLGDSDQVKVGQSVIAIGTALGEFRHTVTTGVISGLGRGITAGDSFGFSSERLDNVIQTDAAINPGNSGGPLLNSSGQVIGVNVAVAGGAQNIGFAIPINVIKESLNNFNQTGKFERPFMGIQYQMIPQKTAIMNSLPEGAYLAEVVADSSASDAGLQNGDVITKFDGQDVKGDTDLASLINKKKVGDRVQVEYWRNGEKKSTEVTLKERAQ